MPAQTEDLFNNERTMPEEKAVVSAEEWNRHVESQSMQFAVDSMPTPKAIKFDGNNGGYSVSTKNRETKEWEKTEIGESFNGVILAVRYMVKWKFEENNAFDIRSREFKSFADERIEVLKIVNSNRSADPEVTPYYDYADLKAKTAMSVPMSDKVKHPFDLWVSLYAWTEGEMKRFRFRGTSRSEFFDYKNLIPVPTVVVTKFGTSAEIESKITEKVSKMEGGKEVIVEKPKTYHSATFTSMGDVPAERRSEVMEASVTLRQWMSAWEAKRGAAPAVQAAPVQIEAPNSHEPIATVPTYENKDLAPGLAKEQGEEEINLSDIPF